MDHALSRLLTRSALVTLSGVLTVAACTHTTERVVEPVGGGDAATTPGVADAEVKPIGPIAEPIEPVDDFRLVRAPLFGNVIEAKLLRSSERQGGVGGAESAGAAGFAGSDQRPVACGGRYD